MSNFGPSGYEDYRQQSMEENETNMAEQLDIQKKYPVLLINNKMGFFYVSEQDNNTINNLDDDKQKKYVKEHILGLFTTNKGDIQYFEDDPERKYDESIFVKEAAVKEAMKRMMVQIEGDKIIDNGIQSIANLPGSEYFSKMIFEWNNGNPDKSFLPILKARQEAVTKTPSLKDDGKDPYTYGLTVRLDRKSKQCVKSKDLWLPDGKWEPYATNRISYKDEEKYEDVISAVYAERKCSKTNQFMDKTKSAFSNTLSRFRSSSSSPAAGGRRSKKRRTRGRRPSRRARKSRVRGRKSLK